MLSSWKRPWQAPSSGAAGGWGSFVPSLHSVYEIRPLPRFCEGLPPTAPSLGWALGRPCCGSRRFLPSPPPHLGCLSLSFWRAWGGALELHFSPPVRPEIFGHGTDLPPSQSLLEHRSQCLGLFCACFAGEGPDAKGSEQPVVKVRRAERAEQGALRTPRLKCPREKARHPSPPPTPCVRGCGQPHGDRACLEPCWASAGRQ